MAPNGGLELGIAGATQACIRLYEDQKRTAVGGQALSIALACCFTCTEVKVEHCMGEPKTICQWACSSSKKRHMTWSCNCTI